MEVVFIIGAFLSLFLAFLLFRKKNGSVGDHILGAWLTVFGLNLLYYYFFTIGLLFEYPHRNLVRL